MPLMERRRNRLLRWKVRQMLPVARLVHLVQAISQKARMLQQTRVRHQVRTAELRTGERRFRLGRWRLQGRTRMLVRRRVQMTPDQCQWMQLLDEIGHRAQDLMVTTGNWRHGRSLASAALVMAHTVVSSGGSSQNNPPNYLGVLKAVQIPKTLASQSLRVPAPIF